MSFFLALKKKLERAPDRNSDQRFWARFENEFGSSTRSTLRFGGWRMASASVLAIVLVVFAGKIALDRFPRSLDGQSAEAQFLQDQELFENLELLSTFDDPDLEEQDWNILLGEEPRET